MRIYFVRSVRIYLVCSAFYFVRCVTSCYMEEYYQERCVPYKLPYPLTSFMHRVTVTHSTVTGAAQTTNQSGIFTHGSRHDKAITVIGTGLQNYFNPATNDVLERFVQGEIWTIWRVDQL